MTNSAAAVEPAKWLNSTVLGIGLASFAPTSAMKWPPPFCPPSWRTLGRELGAAGTDRGAGRRIVQLRQTAFRLVQRPPAPAKAVGRRRLLRHRVGHGQLRPGNAVVARFARTHVRLARPRRRQTGPQRADDRSHHARDLWPGVWLSSGRWTAPEQSSVRCWPPRSWPRSGLRSVFVWTLVPGILAALLDRVSASASGRTVPQPKAPLWGSIECAARRVSPLSGRRRHRRHRRLFQHAVDSVGDRRPGRPSWGWSAAAQRAMLFYVALQRRLHVCLLRQRLVGRPLSRNTPSWRSVTAWR